MAASHIKRGQKWYIKAHNPDTKIGFRGPIDKLAGLWSTEMKNAGRENVQPRTERDVILLKSFVISCLARGEDPERVGVTSHAAVTTMAVIFRLYIEFRELQRDTGERPFVMSDTLKSAIAACAFFGELEPRQMNEQRIRAFVLSYTKRGVKASTPNHYLRLFASQACDWAAHQKPPLMADPFNKHEYRIPINRARKKMRCAPDLETILLAACAELGLPWLADFIVLAIDLGCREDELLRLTLGDVDWQRCTVTFRATKRRTADGWEHEDRVVPFNPKGRVARILQQRALIAKKSASALVIVVPTTAKTKKGKLSVFYKAWRNIVIHAHGTPRTHGQEIRKGTPEHALYKSIGLTPHGLRHEALTWWGLHDVDVPIQDWLAGHVSQQTDGMNPRYNHSIEVKAREALAELVWPFEGERGKVVPNLSQSGKKRRIS